MNKKTVESKKILSGVNSLDFVIETGSQRINFKRGRSIKLGVNKTGNPFILTDGILKQKNSYNRVDVKLEFTSTDLFRNYLKECFCLNEEVYLSKKELPMIDSVVKENLSLESVVQKCIESNNMEKISHTVIKRKINVLPTYKVEKIIDSLRLIFKNKESKFIESKTERNLEIKKIGINKSKSLESKGFIINNYLIENEDELDNSINFIDFLVNKLNEIYGEEYKVEISGDDIQFHKDGEIIGSLKVDGADFSTESSNEEFQKVIDNAYEIQDEFINDHLNSVDLMNQLDSEVEEEQDLDSDYNEEDEEIVNIEDELDEPIEEDDEIVTLDVPSEEKGDNKQIIINLDFNKDNKENSEIDKEEEIDEVI